MQILRNEVRTGLMVLLTLGLAVTAVLYISSPGLFRPLKSFQVYFDDAAGIKPGAAVLLAGRKIGTVAEIQSPVPINERPEHKLSYEAMVRVQVAQDAQIYKETTVTMRTFGLLTELVIDFTNGDPDSGLAETNAKFVARRSPDLAEVGPVIIQKLEPALKQSEATLAELQKTSHNLTMLTAQDSVLTGTLKSFGAVGENLKTITAKGGGLDSAVVSFNSVLYDLKEITGPLEKDNNLEKTLVNFQAASSQLKVILDSVEKTMDTALPRLNLIITDLSQLSGKLKEQPWRIIWPSTIKYPEGRQAAEHSPPTSEKRRVRN
ncbi:MAG: MCE family protein [Verrucomicrobia bacterium]|nr:MCE family protein [Verrucomicrobiota bacterium]